MGQQATQKEKVIKIQFKGWEEVEWQLLKGGKCSDKISYLVGINGLIYSLFVNHLKYCIHIKIM